MAARNSRKASDIDKPAARIKRRRVSGLVDGRLRTGHDKMGRPKYARPAASTRSRTSTRPPPTARGARRNGGHVDPERYPNMAAWREHEHAQHVLRGLRMGMTRGEAEAHARRDEAEGLAAQGWNLGGGVPGRGGVREGVESGPGSGRSSSGRPYVPSGSKAPSRVRRSK